MDWRSIRFDWNRARAFLVTAEEGTFSSASRALAIAQPTVGRQVAALEQELGVTLFERVGTRLELTDAGLDLLEHVRAMGDAANRVSLGATGRAEAVEGIVAITASEAITTFLLPPVVTQLRRDHPGIEIELVVANEARDLQRREADIAVRNFAVKQPDLIARNLGARRGHAYATPEYLDRIGPPTSMADLGRADWLGFDRTPVMRDGLVAMGVPLPTDAFPVVVSHHVAQWALCCAGAGIGMMMEEVGDPEPRVVRALADMPPFPVPMWLVCHRELRTSRRIRVVFDALADALSAGGG